MNSNRDKFYAFMSGAAESPMTLTAPIFGTYVASQWKGRAQIPLTIFDEHAVEDILDYSDAAGIVPIICVLCGDLHVFGSHWELFKSGGNEEVWRRLYPGGNEHLYEEIVRGPANGMSKYLIDEKNGYEILPSLYENFESKYQASKEKLRQFVTQIGDRAVVYFNVPLPHLLFGFTEDSRLIYDLFDHPDKMREIFDGAYLIGCKMIQMGLEAGVKLFFTATHGIIGPDLLMEYALPYCKGYRDLCDKSGGYLYLHECGKMKGLFEKGFYQSIKPHILEGMDSSPVGDIDDLAAFRSELSKDIIMKGNLRLEFLQKATPAEIRQQTLNVLNAVKGYRHLMGGACSILTGTPPENIRAMVEAVNIYSH